MVVEMAREMLEPLSAAPLRHLDRWRLAVRVRSKTFAYPRAQARKRFGLYEAAHEGGAMRHLRNTLYIFTEDAYATLDGENIVVKQSGRERGVCRCIR